MKRFQSIEVDYKLLVSNGEQINTFPFLRNDNGDREMYCLSPIHGRSFVVGRKNNGMYVVSKGNGLAYSTHKFLFTPEMPTDVWGLLLKEDALRDYHCGLDVEALGIKTNKMECVLELKHPIFIEMTQKWLKPVLLQYSVECPWRIADSAFMSQEQIWTEVRKWDTLNKSGHKHYHMIAAEVLIANLRLMHDNGVLHNALTCENITWALELLDFELCHTPQHPYSREDYLRHVVMLREREVLDIYKQVIYIAAVLREDVNFKDLDSLFLSHGFNLKKYVV